MNNTSSANPYSELDDSAYWRTGVVDTDTKDLLGVYRRKWPIDRNARIGTAGSCFAQHVAHHLRKGGFNVLDVKPAPAGLPPDRQLQFG